MSDDQKDYWMNVPADVKHGYLSYSRLDEEKLYEMFFDVLRICQPSDHFLEIGCATGTNLEYLRRKGFSRFTGIDINPRAIEHFHEIYPETSPLASMHAGDALPIMRAFSDNAFDVVFTKGCLVVIPYEDDDIFAQMARVARRAILIREADPINGKGARYPRDFEKIFTDLGFKLILKKQSYAGNWGNLDPKRPYDSWLRLFVRDTVKVTPGVIPNAPRGTNPLVSA